jgi:hypothetical protein
MSTLVLTAKTVSGFDTKGQYYAMNLADIRGITPNSSGSNIKLIGGGYIIVSKADGVEIGKAWLAFKEEAEA